jgi:hypothetical protein
LTFFDIDVQQPSVAVNVSSTGEIDLIGAFFEGHEVPSVPFRVELQGIAVSGAHFMVRTPQMKLQAQRLEVTGGALWLEGQSLGLDLDLTTTVQVQAGRDNWVVEKLHVATRGVVYQFAHDAEDLQAQRLTASAPGMHFDVHGGLTASDTAVKTLDATGEFQLDTGCAVLRANLDPFVVKSLQGSARGHFKLLGPVEDLQFHVEVTGTELAWQDMQLNHLVTTGHLLPHALHLQKMHMRLADAEVQAEGNVALATDAETTFGQHDLQLTAHRLPMRRLLFAFTRQIMLLPEWVSVTLHSQGRSLWPMTSEVDLHMQAEGIPSGARGLFPDPFVADGKLRTHPDIIEILWLKLGSTTSTLTLQGIVPLRAQGLPEIYRNLHILPAKP